MTSTWRDHNEFASQKTRFPPCSRAKTDGICIYLAFTRTSVSGDHLHFSASGTGTTSLRPKRLLDYGYASEKWLNKERIIEMWKMTNFSHKMHNI